MASGPSPSSPSGEASIYQSSGTYTYRMTPCIVTQTSGMCIPQQATQTITVAVPAPTMFLSFEPAVITAGQTSRLQWTSTNARSCFAPNRSAGLSALYVNGTSGSVQLVSGTSGNAQFKAPDVVTTAQEEWINVVCDSWAGGTVSKRVTLTINRGTTSSSAASSSSTGYFDTDNGNVTSIPPSNPEPAVPVGSLNGSFRVDESGGASYTIPIAAPGSTARKNLRESFCYDGLNRLIKSHRDTLTGGCSLSAANQDQEYDGLGNITRKVGVGNYSYTGKGPHAVTATTLGGSYSYDNNGNQTAGAGRSISYNTQDQPTRIVSSAATTDFVYGPDQARFERRDTKAGNVTITHYLGNVERIQVQGSNVIEWKRYIAGAIYTVRTTTAHAVQATEKSYLFNDHLGSLDVVTNAHGKITHSASFDAWGARRSGENWGAAFAPGSISLTGFVQPLTRRGYTGHEMLDDHGLIHMNGRIYDPKLARFLQADPFIQAVTDTQSFNRYSYVMNNPLNATDPSGFIWSKLWKELKPFVGAIVTIVVSVVCTVCGPMVAGAIGGAVGAAVNGGNIIMGAAFGAFSGAVGGLEGISGFIARGMLGGMQTAIAGGKFGHGFAAAGIGGLGGRTSSTAGFVRSSILGGTASEITGGKFANGASTAAFSYAMSWAANRAAPGDSQLTPEEQADLAKRQGLAMDEVKSAYESGALGEGRQFSTIDGAAKEVLGVLDPISQKHKVELGGFISASGDGFTYGTPIVGTQNSLPGLVNVPRGALAGFHTHPSGSRFFSIADTQWVNGTNGTKIPLYMSAHGQVRACEVSSFSCSPTKASFFRYDSRNPGLQGRIVP